MAKTLEAHLIDLAGTPDVYEALGPDVLTGRVSFRQWCVSHGFSHYDRLIPLLPKDLWDKLEPLQAQARASKYRESKHKAELKKYNASSIEELLSKEVLEGRLSIRRRLRDLGMDPSNIGEWIQHNIPEYLLSKLQPLQQALSRKETVEANKELYGSASPFGSELVRNKSKATMLERYGVSTAGHIPGIQVKREATNLERYGMRSHRALLPEEVVRRLALQNLEPLIPIDKPSYEYKDGIPVRCKLCGREFTTRLLSTQRTGTHTNAYKCCECQEHSSLTQDFARNYIRSLGYTCEQIRPKWLSSPRSGKPLEIDCYIDELKIGFEIDGYFTHNSDINEYGDTPKSPDFHSYKTTRCLENSIKLYHIWHDSHSPKAEAVVESIVNLAIDVALGKRLPELDAEDSISRDICPDPSIYGVPYEDLGPQAFKDPDGRTCYTSGHWRFKFN